jgi:5-methylthioadenosine/S-adenosylhomocysteine deaminase
MTNRRQVLAGAAAVAGAGALGLGSPAAAEPENFSPDRPILFRRATVVTMDPAHGVLSDTDVLVRGATIEAVGQRLPAPAHTAVIDAAGALLLPGFVDTHRHMWQSVFRGVGADWTLTEYFDWVLTRWGPLFRPEDIYASNYMGMVEAIDNGVTTVMDWSHGLRTPEHADAAVDALFAVPGRARFGYGNDYAPSPVWVLDGRVDHMLTTRFASQDQLVTMQLAIDYDAGFDGVDRVLQFARDRRLPISSHIGAFGTAGDELLNFLGDHGALSPSYTLVHANTLSDDSYRRIAETGAQLSISAESELNAGTGYPPTARARQHGISISLSQDTMVWWSGDMFQAMRATLNADRGLAHLRAHEAGQSLPHNDLRAEHVVEYATIGGARVLGLDHLIGSITPGKRADLVLLGTRSPAMTPTNNPAGTLVFHAGRADVDTVLVNGRVLKRRGVLVGVDLPRARRLIEESLSYLRARIPDEEWQQAMAPPR